jgi:hypothetical protein
LALEGGMELRVNILKSIGFFLAGGYSYRRIGDITGSAFYKKNDKDSNGDGFSEKSSWTGNWMLKKYNLGRKPIVDWEGMDKDKTSDFILDLSEFYLRIGLFVGF